MPTYPSSDLCHLSDSNMSEFHTEHLTKSHRSPTASMTDKYLYLAAIALVTIHLLFSWRNKTLFFTAPLKALLLIVMLVLVCETLLKYPCPILSNTWLSHTQPWNHALSAIIPMILLPSIPSNFPSVWLYILTEMSSFSTPYFWPSHQPFCSNGLADE